MARPPLFGPANRPYWAAIAVATSILVGFMVVTEPFASGDREAVGATQSTTTLIAATTPPEATTTTGGIISDGTIELAVSTIATGLDSPVFVTTAPGGRSLYVVERLGTIRVVDPDSGSVSSIPFLDVRDKTNASKGIELGLLGLAFHPEFSTNGRFYVYYTDLEHDTALVEYRIGADGVADPDTERLLLEIDRADVLRHNAGMIQFGPDGYLYVASGDAGQPEVNGQDPNTLLGVILRIDVDGGVPYGIPEDNPFVDGGGAPEVWAYGLRNPWRFSIDGDTIHIGDVGQAAWEEIDIAPLEPLGHNFGWPATEGTGCYLEPACDPGDFTLPAVQYGHDEGCSVTGGYTYRGTAMPGLVGTYFFSDWCSGWIRTFRDPSEVTDWTPTLGTLGQVTSFGVDADGELLYVTSEGIVGRFVDSAAP